MTGRVLILFAALVTGVAHGQNRYVVNGYDSLEFESAFVQEPSCHGLTLFRPQRPQDIDVVEWIQAPNVWYMPAAFGAPPQAYIGVPFGVDIYGRTPRIIAKRVCFVIQRKGGVLGK